LALQSRDGQKHNECEPDGSSPRAACLGGLGIATGGTALVIARIYLLSKSKK
jgi:hypothetical protein